MSDELVEGQWLEGDIPRVSRSWRLQAVDELRERPGVWRVLKVYTCNGRAAEAARYLNRDFPGVQASGRGKVLYGKWIGRAEPDTSCATPRE